MGWDVIQKPIAYQSFPIVLIDDHNCPKTEAAQEKKLLYFFLCAALAISAPILLQVRPGNQITTIQITV